MTSITNSSKEVIEDHALEAVPVSDRQSWLKLSWNTVGIVTTLVALYVGALLTFVAGFRLGLLGGAIVAVISGCLGWGVGYTAFRSGLASGMLARFFGFGVKGSALISSLFGFMMIGFLAAENVLLYEGLVLFFNLQHSVVSQVFIYGALVVCWILLTTYGFKEVSQVSSLMLIGFLAMLFYLLIMLFNITGQSWSVATAFPTQMPRAMLESLGVFSQSDKLMFCINLLIGSGGALALLAGDLGRYARRASDIGLAVGLGSVTLGVFMVAMGGIIMFISLPLIIEHVVSSTGLTELEAMQRAVSSPEQIAAGFILIGGFVGALLIVAAQSKAQVMNAYSSSLSLSNIFDAVFGWRPGRFVFVIAANALSVLLLFGDLLIWFKNFLEVLGILTTGVAAIICCDYFVVRRILGRSDIKVYGADTINISGVIALFISFVSSYFLFEDIIPIKALTAIMTAASCYAGLRILSLRRDSSGVSGLEN